MGYMVKLQSYTAPDGKRGSNVVAVREADVEDADILLLSAHHDSVPTAYSTNDNASGVAALLAAVELLKDLPTDTELRFISFTDEENGKLVDQKVVEGTGWKGTYDTYLYSMRWFGGEKPMNTYYQYRNGFLQSIEVKP